MFIALFAAIKPWLAFFLCANHRCIDALAVCNDVDDCDGASNERGCHKQGQGHKVCKYR